MWSYDRRFLCFDGPPRRKQDHSAPCCLCLNITSCGSCAFLPVKSDGTHSPTGKAFFSTFQIIFIIIAGATTETGIMFQKNRPFDDLHISLVHFLLHLRKETAWEMWGKCRRWGYRLSEVIFRDRNQTEGRFCSRSVSTANQCNGENTCARCPDCSNIWLIRTQIFN